MPTSDPLCAFQRLCARLLPRAGRLTAEEYDQIIDALVEVIERRPEWISGLSDEDRLLVLDTLSVRLAAFNRMVEQTPSILDLCTEPHLQMFLRVAPSTVRWHVQRRLDALKESRAH